MNYFIVLRYIKNNYIIIYFFRRFIKQLYYIIVIFINKPNTTILVISV